MEKKKDDDVKKVVSIPLRSDLPAGTRFKFKGRKGLFTRESATSSVQAFFACLTFEPTEGLYTS